MSKRSLLATIDRGSKTPEKQNPKILHRISISRKKSKSYEISLAGSEQDNCSDFILESSQNLGSSEE
jgi:hypothetical protein